MEPATQRLYARIALLLLSALGLFWLARLDYDRKISTNIVDLIPASTQSPEIALVRSLVGERQARVVLFALQRSDKPPGDAATSAFAEKLRESGAFTEVVSLSDPAARDALGKTVYEKRFELLYPSWFDKRHREFVSTGRPKDEFPRWLAEKAVTELDAYIARPESAAFQELIPADPLLLVPTLAEQAGQLGFSSGNTRAALVWAVMRASPFEEAGQEPLFAAVAAAESAAKKIEPEVSLKWTGISRFAAASRGKIHAEMSWMNTLSLTVVLAIALLFVRRAWKALHLVPVVLFSLLGAWVITTMVFERLHILVFVVGSLLTGVAIDYGFYLYMQPSLRPGEQYAEKLGRLLRPLLTSCLTTVIGFGFLLLSELPLIQQLGVFVSAGLLSALGGAILYFAQLQNPFLEARDLPRPNTQTTRWITRSGLAALCIAAAWGLTRLNWRDDVRDLEVPSPGLRENDLELRRLFGETSDRTAYITRGPDVETARANLEKFTAWITRENKDAEIASLALLLPTKEAVEQSRSSRGMSQQFADELQRVLGARGYDAETFRPFFESFRQYLNSSDGDYTRLVSDVRSALTGPLSLLLSSGESEAWFISLATARIRTDLPPELSTIPMAQLESLNSLFARYRQSALRQSAAGLGLVGASVFVLYGLRRGIRIFLIPAGSCLIAFGLLGLMNQPLNLFHLLGAFLGVCLSHNYAIFSAENSGRNEPPPPSIRLSALTTAGSFGVLAFSKIPVVSALGTIVALIVMLALLSVELEPLAARGDPQPRDS
jgi:predicted exporter